MSLLAALELSILLVCIWGFVAVLLTGQFSALIIAGSMVALVIGYRLRRNGWKPSPIKANIAAIIVFLIAGGIFLTTLNLLIAAVYLFLFLQVTKYITRQNLAEARWCYIISLFNIIGAAVITTAVAFGIMLMIYIFLVLVSMRLFVMAREWESTLENGSPGLSTGTGGAINSNAAQIAAFERHRVPRHFLWTSGILSILVMFSAAGLFSAIPRLATQNLFQTYGPPQKDPAVSAFSENVEFGAFTEIQTDNAIALFVQPMGENRPSHVRMRGVALDTFDGKAWRRTSYESMGSRTYDYQPMFTTRLYDKVYKYRIIQPPGVTNFLFGDSFPIELRLPPGFIFNVDRMAQSIYLQDMPSKEIQYEVDSMHENLELRQDPAKVDLVHRPASKLVINQPGNSDDAEQDKTDGFDLALPHHDRSDREIELMFRRLAGQLAREVKSQGDTVPLDTQFHGDFTGSAPLSTDRKDTGTSSAEWLNNDFEEESDDGSTSESRRFRQWNRSRYFRRLSGEEILDRYLAKCLALPENLSQGRVAELAAEWTEDADTTFTKARAIEQRLRTDYRYSLTPTARGNYIEDFLFNVREGHCEYFATSMAVLLRDIGIPARIVNGFYSSEWNHISSMFTVRQKDAHSWVEAWMGDTYGWMTFDPTPPGGVARRGQRNAFLLAISRYSDAARMRWYRYVVDYSITDQTTALKKIIEWRNRAMQSLQNVTILGISPEDATEIQLGDFTGQIDWRPVAVAAAIILLLTLWHIRRWLIRRRNNRFSHIRFYDDLLRILARHGIVIASGQTPMEFADHVAGMNSQWAGFRKATGIYYIARYTGKKPGSDEERLITELKKALKRRKR